MRLGQACVLGLLLVLLLAGLGEAGKRKKDKKRGGKDRNACKIKGLPKIGDCDQATNMKEVTLRLKARRGAPDCPPMKVHKVPCDDTSFERKIMRKMRKKQKRKNRCKYERKGVRGECDVATNRLTVTRTLKPGQPESCPPMKTKTRKCRKRDRKQKRGCVYDKQPWSKCNATTNTRERVLIRVSGDDTLCNPKKLVTKPCKKVCRYDKGEWSECTEGLTHSHRRLTPKEGSPDQCKAFTQSRQCSRLAELAASPASKCRYKAGPWSACDSRSNTVTKVWTLKNGDPTLCKPTKTLARKCKTACRWRRGDWSECDEITGHATRVDVLVKGRTEHCDSERLITRKCKSACKYEWGNWSDCSENTNQRSRVGTLIKGHPPMCLDNTTIYRPCTNRNGEERCFFGPWGDFGPCQNGVMTKHRQVLQGGVECERKAATNRACDEEQEE